MLPLSWGALCYDLCLFFVDWFDFVFMMVQDVINAVICLGLSGV